MWKDLKFAVEVDIKRVAANMVHAYNPSTWAE
jgi:hypothetical protein